MRRRHTLTSGGCLVAVMVVGCSGESPAQLDESATLATQVPLVTQVRLVPLEVSGTIMLNGQPSQARVTLWDNQWSNAGEDDVQLDWTNASGNGEYHLSTLVERGGCSPGGTTSIASNRYYLKAEIVGLVHSAGVNCGIDQTVNINVERPGQSHAAS